MLRFTAFFGIGISVLALCIVSSPSIGRAQSLQETKATVTGSVQQADGAPVPSATVQLIGITTLTAPTDASGAFVFTLVPFGNYRVLVNVKGLGRATREHIVV